MKLEFLQSQNLFARFSENTQSLKNGMFTVVVERIHTDNSVVVIMGFTVISITR